MADVRYQVFISSTYADLKDERQGVIQALLEMDCIPSGMELFPAANEEQFEFIKKVVDLSDYYVLIIGGRYGSITAEGISYTELEYDYALEQGKPVCAFVHSDPGSIPASKTEPDEKLAEKLALFRDKVKKGRLVRLWKSRDELPGKVAISMNHAIKHYPSPGWIRGDQGVSIELFKELDSLRKENETLRRTTAGRQQRLDDKRVPLLFRHIGDKPGEYSLRKDIAIEDCIHIIPTGRTEKNLANRSFGEMVTEHLFGFDDAVEYELSQRSLDDLIFVLDQVGLVVIYDGYIGFTTKFRRHKLRVDFSMEA